MIINMIIRRKSYKYMHIFESSYWIRVILVVCWVIHPDEDPNHMAACSLEASSCYLITIIAVHSITISQSINL